MSRPSMFTMIERRAPFQALAARLRDERINEQFREGRWELARLVISGYSVLDCLVNYKAEKEMSFDDKAKILVDILCDLDEFDRPKKKLPNCPRCDEDELGVIHADLILCYRCGWKIEGRPAKAPSPRPAYSAPA